jgi:hypothetical protein
MNDMDTGFPLQHHACMNSFKPWDQVLHVHKFWIWILLGEYLLDWFHHGQNSQRSRSDDLIDKFPTHDDTQESNAELILPMITGPRTCRVTYAESTASPWPDKAPSYLFQFQLGRVQTDLHCGTAGGGCGRLRRSRACEGSDQTSNDKSAFCKRHDPRACLHCVGI